MLYTMFMYLFWKLSALIIFLICTIGPALICFLMYEDGKEDHEGDHKFRKKVWIVAALVINSIWLNWNVDFEVKSLPATQERTALQWSIDNLLQSPSSYRDEIKKKRQADAPVVRTNIGNEVRRFKLDEMYPPKHFRVDLVDVKTNTEFKSLSVSKHCNNWRDNKLGDEYNLAVMRYKLSNRPGEEFFEFRDLAGSFC